MATGLRNRNTEVTGRKTRIQAFLGKHTAEYLPLLSRVCSSPTMNQNTVAKDDLLLTKIVVLLHQNVRGTGGGSEAVRDAHLGVGILQRFS